MRTRIASGIGMVGVAVLYLVFLATSAYATPPRQVSPPPGVGIWTSNGPAGARLIQVVVIDPTNPSVIYAGAQGNGTGQPPYVGGVFKSTDGGNTWSPANVGMGNTSRVLSLAIDPANTSILYAGLDSELPGEGGVYKSTNGGATWAQMITGLTNLNSFALAIDPSNTSTVYVGTHGGVFKSLNGGNTWTEMNSGLGSTPASSLAMDRTNTAIIYAGTFFAGVFKTTNGGTSWTAVNSGLPASSTVLGLAIDPTDSLTLYAGANYDIGPQHVSGLFKSTNGGGSWVATNLSSTTLNAHIRGIAIDPSNVSILYAGVSGDGVFKTTNGGTSWTAMNAGLPNLSVQWLAVPSQVPTTVYAGIFDSVAGGVFSIQQQPPTYVISGNVFVDTNRNGAKDSGESNYSGVTVTLSGTASKTTTTDASGNYSFTGLPGGSYTVALTVPSGYAATTTNPVNIILGPATQNTVVNFGIRITPVLVYVAAGDSVPDGEDLGGCPTGTNCKDKAYSHYLSTNLNTALSANFSISSRNVACSGFTTIQFRTDTSCRGIPYSRGTQFGEASASEGSRKIVTVTVGADNLLGILLHPQNQSFIGCLTTPADSKICDQLVNPALQQVSTDLKATLPQISRRADIVIVTGYYHIFEVPTDPRKHPFRTRMDRYIDSLDSTIQQAVVASGLSNVYYVDFVPTFTGHASDSSEPWIILRAECSGKPTFHDFSSDIAFQFYLARLFVQFERQNGNADIGLALSCAVAPQIHPNEIGQQKIAQVIWEKFGDKMRLAP